MSEGRLTSAILLGLYNESVSALTGADFYFKEGSILCLPN